MTQINRISQFQNEEIDHLRFDRIKIQRKRMEHILQVIKELTFKNNQLLKENAQLKSQITIQKQYKSFYEELLAQKRILVQKNSLTNRELQQYRQTALHQEMLINSLKQEICQNHLQPRVPQRHSPQLSGGQMRRSEITDPDTTMIMQEFAVLQTQYEDLQRQYSILYQRLYSCEKQKENLEQTALEMTNLRLGDKSLSKNYRSQLLYVPEQAADPKYQKLRQKYSLLKALRKQLQKQVALLKEEVAKLQTRQVKYEQVIDLMKQKKIKICVCHVNKLEKMLGREKSLQHLSRT